MVCFSSGEIPAEIQDFALFPSLALCSSQHSGESKPSFVIKVAGSCSLLCVTSTYAVQGTSHSALQELPRRDGSSCP